MSQSEHWDKSIRKRSVFYYVVMFSLLCYYYGIMSGSSLCKHHDTMSCLCRYFAYVNPALQSWEILLNEIVLAVQRSRQFYPTMRIILNQNFGTVKRLIHVTNFSSNQAEIFRVVSVKITLLMGTFLESIQVRLFLCSRFCISNFLHNETTTTQP